MECYKGRLWGAVYLVVVGDAAKEGIAAGDLHRHFVISGDVQAVNLRRRMAFEFLECQA